MVGGCACLCWEIPDLKGSAMEYYSAIKRNEVLIRVST